MGVRLLYNPIIIIFLDASNNVSFIRKTMIIPLLLYIFKLPIFIPISTHPLNEKSTENIELSWSRYNLGNWGEFNLTIILKNVFNNHKMILEFFFKLHIL